MEIENSFWFRHFLICSKIGNMMMAHRGWRVENFAQKIIESGNEPMISYFNIADAFLSELHESDSGMCFINLQEEDGVSIEELAKLTPEVIEKYYQKCCVGKSIIIVP